MLNSSTRKASSISNRHVSDHHFRKAEPTVTTDAATEPLSSGCKLSSSKSCTLLRGNAERQGVTRDLALGATQPAFDKADMRDPGSSNAAPEGRQTS